MRSFPSITVGLLFLLCGAPLASAATKAPAAPSNLAVKALGVNAFQVTWKDNSKNETGWEIRAARKGGIPLRFVLVPTANITSYTVTTNDLPGEELVFQMTAYNGVTGQEKLSKPTSIVTVKALSASTFGKPTMLVAKTIDDGQIRLSWKDNATSENGYQVETRLGTKKWTVLGNIGPGLTFSITTSGYLPNETRSFRVRGFKGNAFTNYSNIATATTKTFQAPSQLVVTALPEGAFSFKWKDRSSAEGGFELQFKGATGDFTPLTPYAPNTTSVLNVSADLSTNYQFRVRAVRLVGTVITYSSFSNVFSIQSTPLASPETLAVTATTDSSAILTWVDKSARETDYEILYRIVGTTPFTTGFAAANSQASTVPDLESGKLYEFRVSALLYDQLGNRIATSGYKSVQVRTREGFVVTPIQPLIVGNSFLFPIQVSLPAGLTSLTVTGLPPGLQYNSGNRTIFGTLSSAGNFTVVLTATFSDGTITVRSLSLNSTSTSPVSVQPFAAVSVPPATPKTVSLAGKFTDPDTASAARVITTKGTFDIILFPFSTPQTVDNFLDYTDAGEYDNMFFHRSPLNFVVQGGGFKHTPAAGFTGVNKFARILPNEPGLSNVEGTVAMAKLGGDPNSATSEWFVNVTNNASNLDNQNGGFTVFGRVPAAGMIVVKQINALPVHDYTVPFVTGDRLLGDIPVNAATAPDTLDPALLVKVTSVVAAPILTYEVLSLNPAIATASLTGTDITVTAVAKGSTSVQVKATDLDGNSVTQNFAVTVP